MPGIESLASPRKRFGAALQPRLHSNDVYMHCLMPDDSLLCQRCEAPLKKLRTSCGVLYSCDFCAGRAVTIELLRKRFTPESVNPLWQHCDAKLVSLHFTR